MGRIQELIRSGTVSTLDPERGTARVIYDSTGMVSGELVVLRRVPVVTIRETELTYRVQGAAVTGRTEESSLHSHGVDLIHEHGGITEPHAHETKVASWLPAVGEAVLCLCLPNDSGDGYILGGI